MKVAICSEAFSHNLGDGVITDCISYLLRRAQPNITVDCLDLSGRIGFASSNSRAEVRPTKLKTVFRDVVSRHPVLGRASFRAAWAMGRRQEEENRWSTGLLGSDLLIIGGGQLLMDNVVFPLRLSTVAHCARNLGIPVAVHACGVGREWSGAGTRQFAAVLSAPNVTSVTTRDPSSLERLLKRVPSVASRASYTPDPGVYAAETYGIVRAANSSTIGLGIAAPEELRRRLPTGADLDEMSVIQFWVSLAERIARAGHPFSLFTNGSPRDYIFAEKVRAALGLSPDEKSRVLRPRPVTARDLVADISGFAAIAAYRLHACIIALSLGVPAVGLTWDEKVQHFFDQAEQRKYCVGGATPSASEVLRLLLPLTKSGLVGDRMSALKRAAEQEAANLLHRCRAAAGTVELRT